MLKVLTVLALFVCASVAEAGCLNILSRVRERRETRAAAPVVSRVRVVVRGGILRAAPRAACASGTSSSYEMIAPPQAPAVKK